MGVILRKFSASCLSLFLIIFSTIYCTYCFSAEIKIDSETISVPAYDGFVEISKISPDTVAMFEDMLPPTNNLHAVFVTASDSGKLLKSQSPELKRYLIVQTAKSLESVALGTRHFAELRKKIRIEYESLFDQNKSKIDELAKHASQKLSDRISDKFEMKVGEMLPMSVNSETVNHISLSSLTKFSTSTPEENTDFISAGTMSMALLKGRVVYLNVFSTYNTIDDLKWTQSVAEKWIASTIRANENTTQSELGNIVPAGTRIDPEVKEVLAAEKSTFSTFNHPKAHDLNISIQYPSLWEAKEGRRPHIVQKFTGSSTGHLVPGCMIIIQELPSIGKIFLDGQMAEEIFPEGVKDYIPTNAVYIDGGTTKIDAEPGAWVKYYFEQEISGANVGMYSLQYMLFYEGSMFALQCSVVGSASEKLILEDAFTSYLPVFQNIGYSILIPDKWKTEVSNTDVALSVMKDTYGENWLLTLLFSAILTWGIGLAPPILIRFAFMKHPVSKPVALILVIFFWVFNFVLFTALGSESKTHGGLLLVAWASYAILRKGPAKYEEKQKRQRDEENRRAEEQKEEKRKRKRSEEYRQQKEKEKKERHSRESRQIKDEEYYRDILGLGSNFTVEDIKRRYRELVAKYHPDKVNHLGEKLKEMAEREMKEINEAYESMTANVRWPEFCCAP